MELYLFVHGLLAWTVTLALLWPLNIAMAALAHRIWRGNKPLLEEEEDEFWKRAAYTSGSIALACLGAVLIDYTLVQWAKIPSGMVHLFIYIVLLGCMIWLSMLCFAIEDFFGAFSFVLIYLYLPLFVLWPINWLLGIWNPILRYLEGWLLVPK